MAATSGSDHRGGPPAHPEDRTARSEDRAAHLRRRAAHPEDRTLGLHGAPNARHLGGLRTTGGRRVRPGRLLRTEALGALTDADVRILAGLGPTVVIDLRHPFEIEVTRPDRLPVNQRVVPLPVYDPGHPVFTYVAAVLLGHDVSAYSEMVTEGTSGAMLAIYRWFVADPVAGRMFAGALREIASAPGPALFHCSAGKDRTGWLSALLLTILGVERDTVTADYLLSNVYIDSLLGPLTGRAGFDMDLALPVLQARPEYLDAAYREADRCFGSFDAYLRLGLGVDDDLREALRETVLD